ncbi:YCF48-related protein [Psychroserpens sp.]
MKPLNFSKYFCILFMCLISFESSAQTWQTLNANTLGWRFEDMQFVDTEVGWVVDGGGQILKTINGGINWNQQYYNSDHYFRSVEFYDENIGFAGTLANGNPTTTLLKTIDGGTNWVDISSNLPVNVGGICGMHMVDENTIFITGLFYADAYIMKSIDQGETWTYTDMGNLCNALVDVYFKDENIGYASGQSDQDTGLRGIIVRTIDGGQTWNTVVLGEDSNERIWKIQELNDSVMYGSVEAHTDTPEYYKSIDGGQTWQLKSVTSAGVDGTIQGIGFLNEDIGWVGGYDTFFYETTNEGNSWEFKPSIGTSFNRFQRINDTLMYTSGTNVYKYIDPSLLSIDEFEITKAKGHFISINGSNIIEENAVIKLYLINNTYCELSIYNTIGQRVKTITQGKRDAGNYEIPFNVNSLAKGQYFVVLYTYHGYESIRIVVN